MVSTYTQIHIRPEDAADIGLRNLRTDEASRFCILELGGGRTELYLESPETVELLQAALNDAAAYLAGQPDPAQGVLPFDAEANTHWQERKEIERDEDPFDAETHYQSFSLR